MLLGMTVENGKNPDPDAEQRDRLAAAVADEAAFEGWTRQAMAGGASRLGLPEGEAHRLFPGGPTDVLAHVSRRADLATVADLEGAAGAALKVRDRIRAAVRWRIERHAGQREAVRRGLALLALPFNVALGAKLLYRTVDALWYAAGDTATDFNFYTKRATLAGVYSATLLYWLSDRSDGAEATWAFLDRRIDDVMRIEKLKARLANFTAARTGAAAARR